MLQKISVLIFAAIAIAAAQTKIDLRTQGKSVDFAAATSTKPSKTGTAFPATCSIGETFFKTDAAAGANLFGCTATNIWTVQSGSTLPAIGGNANKILSNGGSAADWRALGGDISGSPEAVTVNSIRGRAVSVAAPSNTQVLTWNTSNNQWEPQNPSSGGGGANATQLQGRNLASTAPSDTQVICWDAAGATWKPCTASGGAGATSFTQLADLKLTRSSGTQLSVASGVVLVSGVSYLIPAGTVGITAGTGTVRIAIDTSVTPPTGKVYYTAGMSVTCSGMGSCTTPVAAAAFGPDDLQVATWTSTSGVFDVAGSTDLRGIISRNRTLTGSGLISTVSGHTQTISVNTAVMPIYTLAPGTGSALTAAATIGPANRTHHITGTSTVSTITASGMTDGEILILIPDASFATNTSGNIALASTAVVNRALQFVWDATASKWYPSY
ncbi:MAG: hypothetical protein ABJF23_17475 [Bryobacteraceae bacterium]